MITVTFHDKSVVPDNLLEFAVIAAKYGGKWIYCRQKKRTTWEIPGGHREPGEAILDTAKRELYEETGAEEYGLRPVAVYSYTSEIKTSYGLLCYAEVRTLGELPPEMEIGELKFCDAMPDRLTYPEIQPYLFEKVKSLI